jgi:hypothetical protein
MRRLACDIYSRRGGRRILSGDEDQAFGVKPALVFLPPLAPAGDVGAVPFAGVQALFLNVMPSWAKNAHSAP